MNVDVHEAATRLAELIDRACEGEDIVLTVSGRPAVRLVVEGQLQKRRLGFAQGNLTVEQALAPMSEEELAEWK